MKNNSEPLKPLAGCSGCNKPCQFNGLSASPAAHVAASSDAKYTYGCNCRKGK